MGNSVHFSSMRLDWQTPDAVIEKLQKEFGIIYFDPCPNKPTFDGLALSWKAETTYWKLNRWCFVNPPYGRQIGKWCKKAYEESKKGCLVVMLIPSRTDTQWWHNYIMKADEIRFIKGRLKFKGAKNSAPFPSAIVVFKGNKISFPPSQASTTKPSAKT